MINFEEERERQERQRALLKGLMDAEIRGGEPCVGGTRFSVAQLIAELADHALRKVCEEYNLPYQEADAAIQAAASFIAEQRPR